MKILLLILAILMLGCGTDTEVVEEPFAEKLSPVAEDPLSTVEVNREDRSPPHIVRSDVLPEEPGADPCPFKSCPFKSGRYFFLSLMKI